MATPDQLDAFMLRGLAAQRAIDALGAGRPSSTWRVRLWIEDHRATHTCEVIAADSRTASMLAIADARDAWPGCTLYVLDVLQAGA